MSDKNQKEITTLSGFKQALLACKGQHVSIVSTLASGVKKTHFVTVDLLGQLIDTYTSQPVDIKQVWSEGK
ncbi:hypothetical protein [uncultured Pseudoalteromonas sp.]|uniref:hypothetical protein n=1 Tax=uncultured Pseudoalteromonas sp. TaxID=114053 RepID=UPI002592F9A2|nr:hypothetical protein [uncultured Pseudoalteromonas sp.]